MPRKKPVVPAGSRRSYPEELRREAVQMLLDGHSAPSVAERLGLSSSNILYVWKKKSLDQAGPAAQTLGQRVHFLEAELRRVERERDILPLDRSTLRGHAFKRFSRFLGFTVRGVLRSWLICMVFEIQPDRIEA